MHMCGFANNVWYLTLKRISTTNSWYLVEFDFNVFAPLRGKFAFLLLRRFDMWGDNLCVVSYSETHAISNGD